MTGLRLCVCFEECRADFYELAMKARPFSAYLQRLEFMEPEYCEGFYRSIARMTVLVPPDIVDFWASEPDNTMEKFGEQVVFIEIMRVCEREGLLPPALLEGRARRFPAALANHLSP